MTGANRQWHTLEVPLRPGTGTPARCPWGHDLAVAGVRQGWSQDYRSPEWTCEACHALSAGSGVWAMIDPGPARQVTEDHVDEYGLRLVLLRPPTAAGIGAIQLRMGHTTFGEIRFSLCGPDRRAVLVSVEVEEKHRRRGAGRILVAAARARATRYHWTMLPLGEDPVAVAFWATVGALGPHNPHPCTHQIDAQVVPAESRWTQWW
ncbi:GNAT family N-acetyltransferase [Amycolatopsis coloradensis]|uniref:GNAT family N-acetyltransferase n=1 Tax=Amycolatopsis coloradensis TaxID=76021 RepID=UPI001177A75A|nr:GNAT family N-acetyltransferase [Amycolatopsis coloradensis]